MQRPILYSFRRCPYAMRARLAIMISGVECELREILLKDKPASMLAASPKGTVPVLVDGNSIIDESLDIAVWALNQHDPDNWLSHSIDHDLIDKADNQFKAQLDRYKYASRYPEYSEQEYFEQAQWYLEDLEHVLIENENLHRPFLVTPNMTLLDAMIFPFIRQFAGVDRARFDALPLPKLHRWLNASVESSLFTSIMQKYPVWSEGDKGVLFGGSSPEELV